MHFPQTALCRQPMDYIPTPIGFCIEFLLGAKYEGLALLCSEKTIPPLYIQTINRLDERNTSALTRL
jgi:hypothetical protein